MRPFLISILFICAFLATVQADDGYYLENPQSGTVFPMSNTSVQMVSEEVIYSNQQFVTIFVLKNTSGQAQDVTFGFPVAGAFSRDFQIQFGNLSEIKRQEAAMQEFSAYYCFKSFTNGAAVENTLTEASKGYRNEGYQYVFLAKHHFLPRQSQTVTNVYHQEPSYSGNNSGLQSQKIRYLLKTGALWKSKIESANFTFYIEKSPPHKFYEYLPDLDSKTQNYRGAFQKYFLECQPKNAVIEENNRFFICRWSFKNLDPKENIEINWGYRTFNLDLTLLEKLNDQIRRKETKKLTAKYPSFFKEMQNKQAYLEYIFSLSKCETTNGFNEQTRVNPRFLINSIYALRGYKFLQTEWTDFFKQFQWYTPATGAPEFTYQEKKMIENLLYFETLK